MWLCRVVFVVNQKKKNEKTKGKHSEKLYDIRKTIIKKKTKQNTGNM